MNGKPANPSTPDLLQPDIPSNRTEILRMLVGATVRRLTRYSWWPPARAAAECEIEDRDVFRLTAGPLLIDLDSGERVGVASQPSKISVVLWLDDGRIKEPAEDAHRVDACDPIYGSRELCRVVGSRIRSVHVLQREAVRPRWNHLPREVAVRLVCDNGSEMILSHGLHDDSDDFSVLTTADVLPELASQLREIMA